MKKAPGKQKIYKAKRGDAKTKRMLKDRRVNVIVDNFHGDVVWQEKTRAFPCFVIYHNPIDFPGKYCVRLFDGNNPTRLLAVKDTLEYARKAIPPLFWKVPRSETDPPTIVETWL